MTAPGMGAVCPEDLEKRRKNRAGRIGWDSLRLTQAAPQAEDSGSVRDELSLTKIKQIFPLAPAHSAGTSAANPSATRP